MPSTYDPLATQTVTGSAASSITFSSIVSTYTDLLISMSSIHSTANTSNFIRFNGDSGTNYSRTLIEGTGSAANSGRASNQTAIDFGYSSSTTDPDIFNIHIMNYSNSTTFKTVLTRGGIATTNVSAGVGLWRNTGAINSITLSISGTFAIGSTFTLYGIKCA